MRRRLCPRCRPLTPAAIIPYAKFRRLQPSPGPKVHGAGGSRITVEYCLRHIPARVFDLHELVFVAPVVALDVAYRRNLDMHLRVTAKVQESGRF